MDGAPKFTYDFVMGQLRIALVAGTAYASGKGWLTPTDAGALTDVAAGLGPILVPWIASIYSNLGVVHVGSGSAAASVAKVEAVSPANAFNAAAVVNSTLGKVASVLFVAILLGLFLGCNPASAQTKQAPATPVDFLTKLVNDLSAKKAEFVTNVVAAIQEADADAATLTNVNDPTSFRDPISHACYPAQIKFLQSLPQVQPIQAKAPYNLIVLFQRKRDLIAQIQAGLPVYLKLNCAALLGDEKTVFVKTIGLLGVTAAGGALTGLFPAAAPFTLPALSLGL